MTIIMIAKIFLIFEAIVSVAWVIALAVGVVFNATKNYFSDVMFVYIITIMVSGFICGVMMVITNTIR